MKTQMNTNSLSFSSGFTQNSEIFDSEFLEYLGEMFSSQEIVYAELL